MRILISSPAGLGHINPMIPLAQAAQARGHELRWLVADEFCDYVERAGIQAFPAGLGAEESRAECLRRYPEADRCATNVEGITTWFQKIFGAVRASAMLDDLMPIARAWEPQLFLHDAGEFAAPIAAAVIGSPHVTHAYGTRPPGIALAAAAQEVENLWLDERLEPRPDAGVYEHLYVDIYPPSLQPSEADDIDRHQLLRPTTVDALDDERLPPAIASDVSAPCVYLTFGTVFSDSRTFRAALSALGEMDVRLVVTVGPSGDPDGFGVQPPNVHIAKYISQTLLLRACDVVVSHGGSGTVLGALAAGLPQLCLPQGADQFRNAAAVASSGAGIALTPDQADPVAIADSVRQLLLSSGFRGRSAAAAAEIASMPSADEVARVLETLS